MHDKPISIIDALKVITKWCEEQVKFNAEHADVIKENQELRDRLAQIQGTDEFKAVRKTQLDREAEKASKTLAAVEDERRRFGLASDK